MPPVLHGVQQDPAHPGRLERQCEQNLKLLLMTWSSERLNSMLEKHDIQQKHTGVAQLLRRRLHPDPILSTSLPYSSTEAAMLLGGISMECSRTNIFRT